MIVVVVMVVIERRQGDNIYIYIVQCVSKARSLDVFAAYDFLIFL